MPYQFLSSNGADPFSEVNCGRADAAKVAADCRQARQMTWGSLGVTFTGIYEPVEALALELDAMQRDLGLDIPIHVDAASGGFIVPFIQRDLGWDFQIERVKSINASGHKYGLAPLCVGWAIWASKEDLPEELIFYVDCLGGNMPTFALIFSRPGGEIIAQYYNFLRLGWDGYTAVQQANSDTAQWLGEQLAALGCFEMIYDALADAKLAEEEFSDGATDPVPGAPGALTMGFSPFVLRAFSVTHKSFIGRTVSQLADDFSEAPILRAVRDGEIMDLASDPAPKKDDIVTVRADVHDLILKDGEQIGPESDDPMARNIAMEIADVHVRVRKMCGKSLAELGQVMPGGVTVQALFRAGNELPLGPKSAVQFGDVLRLTGPDAALLATAKRLGGHVSLPTMKSEVLYLTLAMLAGYLVGIITVTISGIPFALGTSAGVIMAGVGVSYFRSRNPNFGGPVHEGARSFIQDFGLNAFVAVLSANVGPKVIAALGGDTILWLALIGIAGALIPPLVAFWVGIKVFGLNSIISDGATTGARNSTSGLNAIIEESGSSVAAVPDPVSDAFTTVLD